MKTNGVNTSTKGGKRVFAISLVLALLVAAFVTTSVFAAPPRQEGSPTEGDDTGGVSANQIRELQQAHAWFNNFRTKPGQNRNSDKISQYLDQYAFALGQANAVLVNGGATADDQSGNQGMNKFSAQQNMGMWLHRLRGLRQKIASMDNSNNNNGTNNAGSNSVGIPVTGDDASGTQNTNNNQTFSNSPANMWGNQWRELQAAQTWFNNFRTKPGQDRNSERISRYLDQYAFALRQANTLIAGGVNATTDQQNNSLSQGLSGTQNDRTAAQKQLAQYLHMMRNLRQKIAEGGGGNVNNNNNTNTNTGVATPAP